MLMPKVDCNHLLPFGNKVNARARHVLRRKRDGRYLAADLPEGVLPLVWQLRLEPGLDAALTAMESAQIKPAFVKAMQAAEHRARELGDEFGKT